MTLSHLGAYRFVSRICPVKMKLKMLVTAMIAGVIPPKEMKLVTKKFSS